MALFLLVSVPRPDIIVWHETLVKQVGMKDFPVRVRLRIPTCRAWTTHKTILLVCLSHFEKIMHALNVLGGVSVTVHPLPVHLRALYIIKCVKNHYGTS